MLSFMKMLWYRWKGLAHRIIKGQTWVVMGAAYWIGLGPVALVLRMKNRDLIDRGLGDPSSASHWIALTGDRQDIRQAQRPW